MYGDGFDWIHKWKVSAVTNGTVTDVRSDSGVSWWNLIRFLMTFFL